MSERQQRTEELNEHLYKLNRLIAKLYMDPKTNVLDKQLQDEIINNLVNVCTIANNMRFLYVDEIVSFKED